jgi:hypothetical protein
VTKSGGFFPNWPPRGGGFIFATDETRIEHRYGNFARWLVLPSLIRVSSVFNQWLNTLPPSLFQRSASIEAQSSPEFLTHGALDTILFFHESL